MADDTQDSIWPLPKFYFSVDIEGVGDPVMFQEVSGLDTETETEVIEYRAGDSKAFDTMKMPGIAKASNVVLKKGVMRNDNHFWDWYSQIKMNTIKRRLVVISLLDQTGGATMIWKLSNAWPTKITGTDLKSDGNEVAIEVLELAHEGIAIS